MKSIRDGLLMIVGGIVLVVVGGGSLAAAFVTGEWRLLAITAVAGLILYGST